MSDFDFYQSPYTWRYGSNEMRTIWSESHKRKLWRKIWVALAQAQVTYSLVTPEQLAELKAQVDNIHIERSLEIEAEIHHDLMAEVMCFAEQCTLAGGIIHLGATSMDIEDNADAIRLRQGLALIIQKLEELLLKLAELAQTWAATPVMAFTHLQPAEPTTLGYRFSFYAQDLLEDWFTLSEVYQKIKGKGFKGAVGTGASYIELIGFDNYRNFENNLSDLLNLPFYDVTGQTYPRRQDYQIISALAGLGAGLYKFSFDLRILQSPLIGELSEPFGEKQVGSSAMPFKRNPVRSEKLDSLARSLSQMPAVAWQNAAHSLLERTLDDSANRRSLLPEAFLICDEIIQTASRITDGLVINEAAIHKNLLTFAPFSSTERLLMALVKAGADRQEMHGRIRDHAMRSWQAIQVGQSNPLIQQISNDPCFQKYLTPSQIQGFLSVENYTGIAEQQAKKISTLVQETISNRAEMIRFDKENWTP